jgi:prepilin-type N-terminal cleavage/methylation domain-containing protein
VTTYRRQSGFTIVELLIVIVVIGILAVITVVAYNGIQSRARVANTQGALAQANKKLGVFSVDNSMYPVANDCSVSPVANSICLTAGNGTTYQYSATPTGSSNPTGYCVTATNGTTDYKADSTNTQPAAGACAGHGTGGVAPVTNLVINPSGEPNLTGWAYSLGTGGVGSRAWTSGTAVSGSNFQRTTWTTAPTTEVAAMYTVSGTVAGNTYTARASARPSWAGAQMRIQFYFNPGGYYSSCPSYAVTAAIWTSQTCTKTAPAGTTTSQIQASFFNGTRPAAGDTLDADAFMLVDGSTIGNYADGDSAGWSWTGSAHASTSTGPSL